MSIKLDNRVSDLETKIAALEAAFLRLATNPGLVEHTSTQRHEFTQFQDWVKNEIQGLKMRMGRK